MGTERMSLQKIKGSLVRGFIYQRQRKKKKRYLKLEAPFGIWFFLRFHCHTHRQVELLSLAWGVISHDWAPCALDFQHLLSVTG